MPKILDLTAHTYGRLTVLAQAGRSPAGRILWRCRCTCGAELDAQGNNLRSGNTSSCGCLERERSAARMVAVGRLPNRTKPDDEIGYVAAHDRVRRLRGSASTHSCVDCSRPAQDWSLDPTSPNARPVGRGKSAGLLISPDPADYSPRCKPCHCAADGWAHKAWLTRRARSA